MTEGPLKIDASQLTLRELSELESATGVPLSELMEQSQAKGIAGIAWLVKRRTDPAFTLDQALDLHMGDLEMIVAGEAPAASNGGKPHESLASGT